MSTQEQRAKTALEDAFPSLNAKQIEAIVRFSRLVRFRARSNNALFPMVQRVFGGKFEAKTRKVQRRNRRGELYDALEITTPAIGAYAIEEQPEATVAEEDDREE